MGFLLFMVAASLRHHQRRRVHCEDLARLVRVGVVLSGSATFAGAFERSEVFGLIGVALAAIDLVLFFSVKARNHAFLHRRFAELAKEIQAKTDPAEADDVRWMAMRRDIETEEPPVDAAKLPRQPPPAPAAASPSG